MYQTICCGLRPLIKKPHLRVKIGLVASLILLIAGSSPAARASGGTFNLANFGAVGDKTTDDGPALQRALDALANAGGGTLIVPAGTYAILTPVSKDFTGLASSVTILGVPSSTVVNPKGGGYEVSTGLGLTSEFYPKTSWQQDAISISGLEKFLIKDIAFVGTPGVTTDAKNTLIVRKVREAIIRHCEFYGLSSYASGGSIVTAWESVLKIEQTKFLGSTGNSGVNVPVVQNHQWKGIEVTDSVFVDYGQRGDLYGKLIVAPLAWISINSAAPVTSDSPRRQVFIRDVFLDEGGWVGIISRPGFYQYYSAKVDLVYITGLIMNVSNMWTYGHKLTDIRGVLVEKSRYQWSHRASAAISLGRVGTAILDKIECLVGANRIHATAETSNLYVIDSIYTTLTSLAQKTKVITTVNADDDPVQYVRQQYQTTLGRAPDPAGHFYWSDLFLRCEDDAQCIAATRAKLDAYLGSSPSPTFSIKGRVTDEDGHGLSGFTVNLSGSQTVATQTDANGQYSFSDLPTSGIYTVTANASKLLYTFEPQTRNLTTPAGDQTAQDFVAIRKTYSISGKLLLGTTALGSQQVRLASANANFAPRTVTTLEDGSYTFDGVPAGYAYTVEPVENPFYAYVPVSRVSTNLIADQPGRNFAATRKLYSISGRVVLGTAGVNGVVVQLKNSSGGVMKSLITATSATGVEGYYNFTGVAAGLSYTVEPLVNPIYSYATTSLSVSNLASSQTLKNLAATRKSYTVSGKLFFASAGHAGQQVQLTRTTPGFTPRKVTTLSDGSYTFASVPAGFSYIVEPVASQVFSYTPVGRTVTNLIADQPGRNFTAARRLYELSGRVLFGSDGLNGMVLLLKNGSGVIIRRFTTTTASDTGLKGLYSFAGVPAGLSYTVEPAFTNAYQYQPLSRSYANLSTNHTSQQNFYAQRRLFAISGQVVKTGTTTGIAGVTMTLTDSSGILVKRLNTNSDGTYSLTAIPGGGSYTLRATKTGLAFTPAARSYTNLGNNQILNFSGK